MKQKWPGSSNREAATRRKEKAKKKKRETVNFRLKIFNVFTES